MESSERPLSVSIVAWALLALAISGTCIVFYVAWLQGTLDEHASFLAMLGIAAAIQVTIAVGLLKGSSDARQVFVWLPPAGIVFAMVRGTATESTAVGAYLWAVCMFVLTSPAATLFFTGAVSRSLAAQVTRWMSCLFFPNACVVALWVASLHARADDHQVAADEAGMALQKVRSGYRNEISARGAENDALHRDLATAERHRAELQAKLNRVESAHDTLAEHVSTTRGLMNKLMSATAKLTGENAGLRAQIAMLESDVKSDSGDVALLKSKLAEREFEIASMKKRAAALEARHKRLFAKHLELRELATKMEIALDPHTRSRVHDAKVLTVRSNLVSLSVGSTDGVRLGDVFHLSRGLTYVGSVKIIDVIEKGSVGKFDTEHPGSAAPPKKGDDAWQD